MTLETVALGISALSFVVAGIALGWNIYRDIALKPRVKVRFTLMMATSDRQRYLVITASNQGPGPVVLENLIGRYPRRRPWAQRHHLIILPAALRRGVGLSKRLPMRLRVGDTESFFLTWEADCCMKEPVTRIGVSDTFGRLSWAPRGDVRRVREQYGGEFTQVREGHRDDDPARIALEDGNEGGNGDPQKGEI